MFDYQASYLKELNNLTPICNNNCVIKLPKTIINLKNIKYFNKDFTLQLTPLQKKYFNWIKSNKSYPFDDNVDMVMVKCAYFGV